VTATPRLHWTRGRVEDGARALEWIGLDDEGAARARVVRVLGPLRAGWRLYRAVALDEQGRVVELRPPAPEGAAWLAVVGGRVVGRARVPLAAVRRAEAALAGVAG
jgi:hypothetical protein